MNDERIIAYLLEELSPEEAARFEEECFAAEVWPNEVWLAEDELIEDYLRDGLTPDRRRRFERHYLTTAARRERYRVAAALLRHAAEVAPVELPEEAEVEPPVPDPTPASPTFFERLHAFWGGQVWTARAAAALLIVAAFAAVAWWLTRPPAPRDLVALTLTVSRSERGSGERPASVPLPRGDEALHVTLLLPEGAAPAEGYRVELEDVRGTATPLEPAAQDAQKVSVVIPAARLARGPYALKLYALGDDGPPRRVGGSYFFNVE